MARYVLVRVFRGLFVVVALVIATFVLTHLFADPARLSLPLDASGEQYRALRHSLGLDDPLWKQMLAFLGNAVRGDFGDSTWQQTPAFGLVLERLPRTFLLAGVSIAVAALVGIPLGVIGGRHPGTLIDRASSGLSLVGVSIADFWLGIMLILLFSVTWQLLPTSGYGTVQAMILPIATLSLRPLGRTAKIARDATAGQLNERYIMTARAKGLPERRVVGVHLLKNIAPVLMTILGYEFVFIFTGYAVAVETVFEWPGVGLLAVDAVLHQDVALITAIVVVTGALAASVNILIDVAHKALDPRVDV
jgi:peptide/nickel transport system permease protein